MSVYNYVYTYKCFLFSFSFLILAVPCSYLHVGTYVCMPNYDCAYVCCVDMSVNTYKTYAYVLTSVPVHVPMRAWVRACICMCVYQIMSVHWHGSVYVLECASRWMHVRMSDLP